MGVVSVDQAIVDGAVALKQAWRVRQASHEIDPQRLLVLCGQIWGESNFGRAVTGWRPVFWGTCNYGAIQATPGWIKVHSAQLGWGYILVGDVHADGTPYVYPYRLFPTQLDAAGDYLDFVLPRVPIDKMVDATTYASALKSIGYYEAPITNYIAMVTGGMHLASHAFISGLVPADPTLTTGDDFPPNAHDGKHLPGRVTIFPGGSPPPPKPRFDVTTVAGYQAALHFLSVALNASSLDPGPIDGIKGPRTKAAVVAFQILFKLVPDGIVGPLTQHALLVAVGDHP